jgi:hypothetical protein
MSVTSPELCLMLVVAASVQAAADAAGARFTIFASSRGDSWFAEAAQVIALT